MPGFILHVGASVSCAHGGQATPTVASTHVFVMGQPVTTLPTPYVVAGCTLPPPPAANGPCVSAQWVTASTHVFALAQPVLLVDSQAICAPTGTPLFVTATQTRVFGM